MADVRATKEEVHELTEYALAAGDRHITHPAPFIPGCVPLAIDTDVLLPLWNKILHQGIYQVQLPPDGTPITEIGPVWLWGLELDEESMRADLERAEAEGRARTQEDEHGSVTFIEGSGSFNLRLVRIDVAEDRPLTFNELTVWLAYQDAKEAGNTELADRILWLAYPELRKGEDGKEAGEIPSLDTIAVSTHVSPNSKVSQVLRRGHSGQLFTEGGMPLSVSKRKGQVQIQFELSHEDASIQTSEDLDAEDVAVIEAVTTLRHEGNNVISPGQIAETMGYQPKPEIREEIHRRVTRLMSIVGRIDWTEQARKWHITNPETGEVFEHAELRGNLLSLTVFDGIDAKGNRFTRYKIAGDPITYEHARLVGQVIEYPQELLSLPPIDRDGKELRRVNKNQKKLERAVLWYVYSLKNPKCSMSEQVSYEALFDYEGYVPTSASARQRAVTFIDAYLRALQRAGIIYGYVPQVEQSRRHLQTGVRIIVEKPRTGPKK